MIQIDEVHIEEIRGIRSLTLTLDRKTFAIQGPNGSGKSGVVDAIEFCLTGDMTRLSGHGTGALSVKAHGPHVDVRDYPDRSFACLKVFIPSLNKTATITRKVKSPKAPTIEPADADIVAALTEVSLHPELTLTRRQIARFILAQATTRSKDIQTLLRLEAIDETRSRLKTAMNTADRWVKEASESQDAAADALRRALDVPALKVEDILEVVNKNRAVLGIDVIKELLATTSLTVGMAAEKETPVPSKEAATRDLDALAKHVELADDRDEAAFGLVEKLALLDERPELRAALRQRALVEAGLALADAEACPLCDASWELEALLAHLRQKLEASKEAEKIESEIKGFAQQLGAKSALLQSVIEAVTKLGRSLQMNVAASILEQWRDDIITFRTKLTSVDGLAESAERLQSGWQQVSVGAVAAIGEIREAVKQLPESSDKQKASQLLIVAEERLTTFRQRKRDAEQKKRISAFAREAHNTYCAAADEVLQELYKAVQAEFAKAYQSINQDDEGKFSAKLEPSEGKLELSVDFYERGLFPPGAYHSEGHQDGMGLCLYLALMEQLLQKDFTLAVLDDVVMSVDKQHRRELCRLLKERYPNTQFVITTHDEAWLRQMQASKLVTRKTAVMFRGWSVEGGPRVNNVTDAWEEIEKDLKDERVAGAAATLRRHLEYVCGEIATCLGAATIHKPDGSHDLGDLLPSSVSRMKEHLKAGLKSAKAWKNEAEQQAVEERLKRFTEIQTRQGDEQWVVNKAVHFNDWAGFSREDFEPVVKACHDLVDCFRCEKCGSWLTATPRTSAKILKCDCSAISINLELPD